MILWVVEISGDKKWRKRTTKIVLLEWIESILNKKQQQIKFKRIMFLFIFIFSIYFNFISQTK